MENILTAFAILFSFGMGMGMGMWIGYRLGYQSGVAIWKKSYRYMTPKEVDEHKKIINRMANMDQGH